jgi:hypothetical protein
MNDALKVKLMRQKILYTEKLGHVMGGNADMSKTFKGQSRL